MLQGEYQEPSAARRRLELYSLLALAGVFVLLQQSFNSWRLAVLSFLTLPSALVGGVLAAWLAGGVISLGSLVGFLTVLGIATRDGIIMINHFQHLERYEGQSFGMGLVLRGASERLRPILMTTGAAGLAILPLIIFGDLPGHEIEYPMAVVILGGLLTSTLLNLFILPAFYLPLRPRHWRADGKPDCSRSGTGIGERDVKAVHRHNGWIVAAAAALSALACPVTGAGAEDGRFKSSPFISSAMYRITMPRSSSRPPVRRMGWLR